MKKMLLILFLFAGVAFESSAVSLTFVNLLPCNFSFNIDGSAGGTGFVANGVAIPPGMTAFSDPTALPGVYYTGTAPLSSGIVHVVKGYPLGQATFVLGTLPGFSTTFSSASIGSYPPCNGGVAYDASWSTATSGDVVILIW